MEEYKTEINPAGNLAVDDTLLVKGIPATAGAKILEGFVPLFSAEAVERAEKAGYTVAGKTAVGEFGLSVPELSVSAAAFVASGKVEAALHVDVNGTPRRTAAWAGVDCIKPTYGTVSRYGVIPCACSGEQIGVTAANAPAVRKLLMSIAGHDAKDGTSLPAAYYDYPLSEIKGKKVAILTELLELASEEVRQQVEQYAEKLRTLGVEVEKISFAYTAAAQTAWQILMAAETCNNLSRYDGVKFGYRTPNYQHIEDLYVNTRTEGLSFLTKATILYGSDVLSQNRYVHCYDKALRVRRVISEKMAELFTAYDAVLLPVSSENHDTVPTQEQAFAQVFAESAFTAIPNLIGIPAMVTKGVQLFAAVYGEGLLFSMADAVERMG